MDREVPRRTGQFEESKGAFACDSEGISWYQFTQDKPRKARKEAESPRKKKGGEAGNKDGH